MSLGLLLFLMPATVQAQWNYTTNAGAITIVGYTGPGGEVTIPDTIDGLPVTKIGDYAFISSSGVTSVLIGAGITSISMVAFYGCTALTEINVDILNPVYSSVDGVLFDQSQTTLIRYPMNKTGDYTIPDGVTSVGTRAFDQCTSLTKVTMLNSLTIISNYAFSYCVGMASVTIGGSITNIENGVFFSCTSLTNVTFPNSVISIGNTAFHSCAGLTSVTVGNSVVSIGSYAFGNCDNLSSVMIPNSVTNIHSFAFDACYNLTNIAVADLNPTYSDVDGVLFNENQTVIFQYPQGKLGGYNIPESVTRIADFTFSSRTNLTSITIPNSTTSIGLYAFSSCTKLQNVTIPGSLTNIGEGAFAFCGNLASVAVLNSFVSIGIYAFNSCLSLTNITLGDNVTRIGEGGFYGCSSLASIILPNSVTIVEGHTFYQCNSLTSATIGNNVTNIGEYAFRFCSSMTGVYFQGNAPDVGPDVFASAYNATVYFLPGTTGWDLTLGGRPTALWVPELWINDNSFGIRTNQFGFNIAWAEGMTVVVEAYASLANPIWSPLQTNTLTSDTLYFCDPHWTNYPARFYSVRWP